MRAFFKTVDSSVSFNASLRRGANTTFNITDFMANQLVSPSTSTGGGGGTGGTGGSLGDTGDWTMSEVLDPDGASVLTLLYKGQQVHTFMAK